MAKINSALFIKEITVTDPDSGGEVAIAIYKHRESNGMFGIDSSFVEQVVDDESPLIPDPFNADCFVSLDED